MKNHILQLFNIRKSEAWLVSNLFWMQFFQGVGVAVFNTVAFAMFLEHFSVNELPKVYLFSALLLWLTGFLYSKFEHALSVKVLALGVIIFVSASILFFRMELMLTNAPLFLFLMFSWYYVIYLLTNLEFWGIAALLFDIRQSKRLFGMIGAGDIPAKLIGYSAVPILVKFTQNENVLLISVVSVLLSLVFYYRLHRAGKLDIQVAHAHEHHHAHAEHATSSVRDIAKSFFGNRMIATVALLSFIVVTCVTIISFSFYSEIKLESKTDEQLAAFIAMFYAGGRVLAIVIRLVLTGRLTNLLGTKGSLLISPVILFVFLVAIIFLPFITHHEHTVIYIFGLMAIITEVLKTSLQDPVFLSLMQPLASHLRLKGHTIVKGVMDPFALAFSGFMLFSLLQFSGKVDLFLLSYLLFTLLIVWVVMIYVVDKEYVRTLVTALNKRYSVGQEINLNDAKTYQVLQQKVQTGEVGEAIYVLYLADKNYEEDKNDLVLMALGHPKEEVRMQALRLAERRRIGAALPKIEEIISNRTDVSLLPEAVKAKCMLQPDELENFDEFFDEKDTRLMKAAITGFMSSGGINAVVTAGQKLLALIASSVASERKAAAEIIGDLGIQSFYKPLLRLLSDENEEVVKATIAAAGRVKNAKLVKPLLRFFIQRKFERLVLEALQDSGAVAVHDIRELLLHSRLTHQQMSKLILLCGRIEDHQSVKMLDELLWSRPEYRMDILHALSLSQFRAGEQDRKKYLELIHLYLDKAVVVHFMIEESAKHSTAKILVDALHLELNHLRDSLLQMFAFLYDRDKMMRAKSAFQMKRSDSIANALEVIEIEVPKEISLLFIRLFESGDVAEKCRVLERNHKLGMTFEKVMDEIFAGQAYHFHRWTKATALHALIFYKGADRKKWLDVAATETDVMLQETVQKIRHETLTGA
ncbi:MAG: HEAT repeat domain-containing protein [Bacteroidetes bacterium]|nr:HEAT repeat domain-containing protein [Bacteroidota bacterium]